MSDGALVVAYHGCDATVRDRLVKGELKELTPSANKYDWLGPGIYFFENDLERARQFAQAAHQNPTKLYTKTPIATPAVVGAVVRISRWLDMTTQFGLANWVAAYKSLQSSQRKAGKEMPRNEPADGEDATVLLRQLDCAVFTTLHQMREEDGLPDMQAVRAAFYQGQPLASSTSEFREQTHVQIALRDANCVVGWFLPPGDKILTSTAYDAAQERLEAAKRERTASKRRVARS